MRKFVLFGFLITAFLVFAIAADAIACCDGCFCGEIKTSPIMYYTALRIIFFILFLLGSLSALLLSFVFKRLNKYRKVSGYYALASVTFPIFFYILALFFEELVYYVEFFIFILYFAASFGLLILSHTLERFRKYRKISYYLTFPFLLLLAVAGIVLWIFFLYQNHSF